MRPIQSPKTVPARDGLGGSAVERALALHRQGRRVEAESLIGAVLEQNPRHAEANNAMGSLALDARMHDVAISYFRRALAVSPREPRYLNNMALALNLSGNPEEGLPLLLAALKSAPRAYEVLCNVGRCYWQLGMGFQGIPYLEKAIKQHPDRLEALLLLADAHLSAGDEDDAEAICRRVLEKSPLEPGALRGIVHARRQTEASNVLPQIEQALGVEGQSADVVRGLHYSAAKGYIDLHRPKDAFEHLTAAKGNSRRMDRELQAARFKRLKVLYNPVFMKSRADFGVADPTPVFIVGMPRSGTSLTEQIISAHPQVFGAGELNYMHQIANRLMAAMPSLDLHAAKVASMTQAEARQLGDFYLKKVRGFSAEATHITDKMPLNFLYIGLIALLLPKARIIHCRRSPLDNCFSIYSNNFNERHPYAHNLADLGWYYRQYEDLMAHWRSVLPEQILDIQYEDLVDDLEGQTRRMLDFLGLPFDDACLDFRNNRRSVATISRWQVRQPLYRTSIDRWRPYESYLAPLIDALAE